MKIPLTINGDKLVIDCRPDESLLNVLRNHECLSVKSGCTKGHCGACTVLLDGKPVPTCKLPVALARNCEIITLEYFSKTDEYETIMEGFNKARVNLCGYCDSAKIFNAYEILCMNRKLKRDFITNHVKSLAPCCTDSDTLANGIIYALKIATAKGNQ